MATVQLTVTADGSLTSGWRAEGGNYTRLQTNDGDASALYSPTAGDVASFIFSSAGLSGSATINSVTVYHTIKKLDPPSSLSRVFVRLGGTNYESGDLDPPDNTAYYELGYTWTMNPFTGAAWTASQLTSLEAGIKKQTGGGERVTYMRTVVDYSEASADQSISVTSIPSAEAFGTATVSPGEVFITPNGIPSAEAFGTPSISDGAAPDQTVSAYGIPSGEMFGSASVSGGGPLAIERPVNVADKRYIAKVSKADGTYIGVWHDVKDDLRFTQQINTPGTTTTVSLARSAENTIEKRSILTDHLNNTYTDQDGKPYYVTSRTSNTIGPDTDVENGHLIDIFAIYGRFEPLTDHMGRPYTDSFGNPYMVSVGAPLGRPVFRGKIIDYEAKYGATVGVTATIASHGMELTKGEVIKTGSATTVTYSTTPIENIIKNILDTNPGRMSYSSTSIVSTGVSITSKFALNTKLEGIKSAFDQTDAGWYWFGNPADNMLYLKPRSTTADHVFYLGKHLTDVSIKKSAEDLRNRIYFVGGDTGSGTLYRVYEDAAAIAEHGLGVYRITDRRFTQPASAKRYADKIMSRYARPIYTSTIVISAATYDIESIELGQTVGFRNAGNFVDSQVLQIVSRQYEPTQVILELGEVLDDQRSIIADVSEELSNEQYQELPTTPL